jgi:hypothetical protein
LKEMSRYPFTGGDIGFDCPENDPTVKGGITNRHNGQYCAIVPAVTVSDYDRGESEEPTGPSWGKPGSDFQHPHRDREHAGDDTSNEQAR